MVASAVLFLSVSLFANLALPPHGTADSLSHLDYAYQVAQGQLPESHGYLFQYDQLPSRELQLEDQRQFASAHPPLFYALAAIVGSGPMEDGRWEVGVERIRLLNTLFGLATVLTLATAGWFLGGHRRRELAIAMPALGGLVYSFVRHSADVYNDVLVTLLATIALVLTAVLLRFGVRRWMIGALAVICAAGMATKATFAFTLLLVVAAVVIAQLTRAAASVGSRVLRAATSAVVLLGVPALATGWFYQRNLESSGSWFRSTPKGALLGRAQTSLADVLTDPKYYLVVPRGLLGARQWWPQLLNNASLSVALVLVCAASIVAWLRRGGRWRRLLADRGQVLVAGLLLAQVAGLYLAQAQHAVGWGAINFRYFLPALLPIAFFLALGALGFERRSGAAVAVIAGLLTTATVVNAAWYLRRGLYESFAPGEGWVDQIKLATASNGHNPVIVYPLFGLMAGSVLAVGWCVRRAGATSGCPGLDEDAPS